MEQTPTLSPQPDHEPDPVIEELFLRGLHFGYSKTRRHPRMRPFLAGLKNNVEIFNLEKVLIKLNTAKTAMEQLGQKKSVVLWVGTKPQAGPAIQAAAAALGHPFVAKRWLGGTLTNFTVIRKRVQQWLTLERERVEGKLEKYTKQERVKIHKQIERFEIAFRGLELLSRPPEALIIIDPKEETTALREATQLGILTIALLNSDSDPLSVTHAIPGNDNAPKSIHYIIETLRDAYEKGAHAIPASIITNELPTHQTTS
ncbi:MAG: 30S ribosomal protein S2 [Patescibacteria group bacterium]